MNYAVVFGSDVFIGTTGVISFAQDGKTKEFFTIREIFRERSEGSYLAVDCDIKDEQGNREIKLAKSRPVANGRDNEVVTNKTFTEAKRTDGSIIIKIEQLDPNTYMIPWIDDKASSMLKTVSAIIRITGKFTIGNHLVVADEEKTKIGGLTFSQNLSIGGKGIILSENGLSFG